MWWERCRSLMLVPRWEAPPLFPRILWGDWDQISTTQRIVVCDMNGQKGSTVLGLMTWAREQHNIHSMDSYREIPTDPTFIWVQWVCTHDLTAVSNINWILLPLSLGKSSDCWQYLWIANYGLFIEFMYFVYYVLYILLYLLTVATLSENSFGFILQRDLHGYMGKS